MQASYTYPAKVIIACTWLQINLMLYANVWRTAHIVNFQRLSQWSISNNVLTRKQEHCTVVCIVSVAKVTIAQCASLCSRLLLFLPHGGQD